MPVTTSFAVTDSVASAMVTMIESGGSAQYSFLLRTCLFLFEVVTLRWKKIGFVNQATSGAGRRLKEV